MTTSGRQLCHTPTPRGGRDLQSEYIQGKHLDIATGKLIVRFSCDAEVQMWPVGSAIALPNIAYDVPRTLHARLAKVFHEKL